MAGADYIHCASEDPNCKGHKLIYAGDIEYSERPKIYCSYCYEKLMKKIAKLEKRKK
jgi:hypothetical protein